MNQKMLFHAIVLLLNMILMLIAMDAMQPMHHMTWALTMGVFGSGVSYAMFFNEWRRMIDERRLDALVEHARKNSEWKRASSLVLTVTQRDDDGLGVVQADGVHKPVRMNDLRPDVADALSRGSLSHEQMQYLIAKTGPDKDGMS